MLKRKKNTILIKTIIYSTILYFIVGDRLKKDFCICLVWLHDGVYWLLADIFIMEAIANCRI